ncbi:MAG: hypothetical protein U1A78_36065 [Polyangia bacterium]
MLSQEPHRRARGGSVRRGRRGRGLELISIALLVLACRPSPPSGQPADAVRRFYAAAARHDCSDAMRVLGGPLRSKIDQAGRCAELLEQVLEHPLEHLLDTQVDGRDASAHLVRARLRGRATDLIIRVKAEDGQWKIVAL